MIYEILKINLTINCLIPIHIRSRFNTIPFTLSELMVEITSSFNSIYDLKKVQHFMRENRDNLGVAASSFKQVLENIETNLRWMEKNSLHVTQWLINNKF